MRYSTVSSLCCRRCTTAFIAAPSDSQIPRCEWSTHTTQMSVGDVGRFGALRLDTPALYACMRTRQARMRTRTGQAYHKRQKAPSSRGERGSKIRERGGYGVVLRARSSAFSRVSSFIFQSGASKSPGPKYPALAAATVQGLHLCLDE